jgi:hypothetical protein
MCIMHFASVAHSREVIRLRACVIRVSNKAAYIGLSTPDTIQVRSLVVTYFTA